MDRRPRIAIFWVLLACGHPAPRHASGLKPEIISRGTLGYAVAWAGDRLVRVELEEHFALHIDDHTLDLGPPERDWTALACAGDRCWVGGESGEVVEADLDANEIARWPVGAPVTAIAVADDRVAIGDSTGVLCLRRISDGALLQCVVAQETPVHRIDVIGDAVLLDGARAWQLPALTGPTKAAPSPARFRVDGRRVLDDKGAIVVEMAGAIQGTAISPTGALAVAAWIGTLDQPSVVVIR